MHRHQTSYPPAVRLGQEISLLVPPTHPFPLRVRLNVPAPQGALVLEGERFYGKLRLAPYSRPGGYAFIDRI